MKGADPSQDQPLFLCQTLYLMKRHTSIDRRTLFV